ncbi:unnamed protein product [Darwinula stevensoni]|uniref:DNA-repair protein Xrcc1 N-terminal domain-containing protein n=1 Tax=Darwinula stevensoni TaxID=69355 RepID=A0A7R8XFN1_9CRUS|nr:unnamed protein product [Darwinula stevensoni]CAG0891750.1 unnamed protein product [Darwinula stevensoni]
MPLVKLSFVVSFSSQDVNYPAENLTRGLKWLTDRREKLDRAEVDIQLERYVSISHVDIGNNGSASVALYVGKSSWHKDKEYVLLIPTFNMMTPLQARLDQERNCVRMFSSGDMSHGALSEKWDRVRIICCQPFRKDSQFGLSFIRIYSDNNDVHVSLEASPLVPKTELLFRGLQLPSPKQPKLSSNVLALEQSRHFSGTSPMSGSKNGVLSRSAQLVSLATHSQGEQSSSFKAEALQFLTGLKLKPADLKELKVSNLRRQLESARSKVLDKQEKLLFIQLAQNFAMKLDSQSKDLNKKPAFSFHHTPRVTSSSSHMPSGSSAEKRPNPSSDEVFSAKRRRISSLVSESRQNDCLGLSCAGTLVDNIRNRNDLARMDVGVSSDPHPISMPKASRKKLFTSTLDSNDDVIELPDITSKIPSSFKPSMPTKIIQKTSAESKGTTANKAEKQPLMDKEMLVECPICSG